MPSRSRNTDVASPVRQAIATLLPDGHPAIRRVARIVGVNARTLQRRLAEAGITYRRVVDDVRSKAACRLLDDRSLNLSEIAFRLGYSDPAHFTRAFTRWTGMTPRAYRRRDPQNRTDRELSPNGK